MLDQHFVQHPSTIHSLMHKIAIKHLLLGVTGGVAAYKAAEFVRLALKAGIEVRVVMTDAATRFVGPETFQALTGQLVYTDAWDERVPNRMPHISLTRWADALLIAPASADFIARAAAGMADDLLATCAVSRDCAMLVAPAMNREMWDHPATQRNVQTLKNDGVMILGPAQGDQACGETGFGRLLEPQELLDALLSIELVKRHPTSAGSNVLLSEQAPSNTASHFGALAGKHVLVTAGPTFEPIDPVRGITNGSSGKMGYAVAAACAKLGARVTLVSGPVSLPNPQGCDRIAVMTTADMHQAVMAHASQADLFFAVAAVADYTPEAPVDQKIKKTDDSLILKLLPTRDILADVAVLPNAPFCIGFAAETHDLERFAREKRSRKGIPVIAANLAQSAIGADHNTLWVADDQGSVTLGPLPKNDLAEQLVRHVIAIIQRHS